MTHGVHYIFTTIQKDLGEIPKNVKLLVVGIFFHLLGWGIVEGFLSVYFNYLFNSYFIVGLLFFVYYFVAMLFSAPIGDLADKAQTTKIISGLMFIYPLIAVLYFASAIFTGFLSLFFIFFARMLHGFASTFWVVVEAFVRQNSAKNHTAGIFGFYFTFHNISFCIGILLGILSIILLNISLSNLSLLFLPLLFTPIIAGLLILKIPSKPAGIESAIKEVIEKDKVFKKEIRDFKNLGNLAPTIIMLGYFMNAIRVLAIVFLPLLALNAKLSLLEIGVLSLIMHIPLIFSFILAELADRVEKFRLVSVSFLVTALLLIVIALFAENITIIFVSVAVLSIFYSLLLPTVNALLTEITPVGESGEMTGIFFAVENLSTALNSLIIGALASLFGISFPFIVFGALFLLISLASFKQRKHVEIYQKTF